MSILYTAVVIMIVLSSSIALAYILKRNGMLDIRIILSIVGSSVAVSILFPIILAHLSFLGALFALLTAAVIYITLVLLFTVLISLYITEERVEAVLKEFSLQGFMGGMSDAFKRAIDRCIGCVKNSLHTSIEYIKALFNRLKGTREKGQDISAVKDEPDKPDMYETENLIGKTPVQELWSEAIDETSKELEEYSAAEEKSIGPEAGEASELRAQDLSNYAEKSVDSIQNIDTMGIESSEESGQEEAAEDYDAEVDYFEEEKQDEVQLDIPETVIPEPLDDIQEIEGIEDAAIPEYSKDSEVQREVKSAPVGEAIEVEGSADLIEEAEEIEKLATVEEEAVLDEEIAGAEEETTTIEETEGVQEEEIQIEEIQIEEIQIEEIEEVAEKKIFEEMPVSQDVPSGEDELGGPEPDGIGMPDTAAYEIVPETEVLKAEHAEKEEKSKLDEYIEEAFKLKAEGDYEGAILYFMYALDSNPPEDLIFWIVLDLCVMYKYLGQQEMAKDILESYVNTYGSVMGSDIKAEIERNLL